MATRKGCGGWGEGELFEPLEVSVSTIEVAISRLESRKQHKEKNYGEAAKKMSSEVYSMNLKMG